LPGSVKGAAMLEGIKAQMALVVFVLYGLVMAYAGPRIFANQMEVPPLRFTGLRYIYDAVPLVPTSQNITTSIYMIGTLATAIAAYAFSITERAPRTIVRTALVISWVHMFLGVSGALFGSTPYGQVLAFFRNGAYAQLDNDYKGYVRLAGILPEASSYAAYAFAWFLFMFECWYRNVMPKATGITALCLAAVLVASSSSSAYVSLGVYAAVVAARLLLVPQSVTFTKMGPMLAAGLAVACGAGLVGLAAPKALAFFGEMLTHMTVDKSTSNSGLQRVFWAMKGWEAFKISYGLGIGPGSFRSSSIITAILGSMGFVGFLSFLIYVLQASKPLRMSTYVGIQDETSAIGAAASWTVIGLLIPASVAEPSANPGILIAVFGASALALRKRPLTIVRTASGTTVAQKLGQTNGIFNTATKNGPEFQ
jgi:hypothetical protein